MTIKNPGAVTLLKNKYYSTGMCIHSMQERDYSFAMHGRLHNTVIH